MPFLESCFYGIQVKTETRWIFMDFRGILLKSWEHSKTESIYVVGLPCPLVVEYLKYTLTTLLPISLSAALPFIFMVSTGLPWLLCLPLLHLFTRQFPDFVLQRLEWCAQSMQYPWTHFSFFFLIQVFVLYLCTFFLFIHAIQTFHILWLFIYLFILYIFKK